MPAIVTQYPQFFTATNLNWKNLLEPDKYKDIIMNSLRFLVENKRIRLYAFVIMSNPIHLIWQMQAFIDLSAVQRDSLNIPHSVLNTTCKKVTPRSWPLLK